MIRLASPAGVCATAEGRDLVAAVRRCQTRARIVVFVNQMFSAIAIGAAATLVWHLAWAPAGEGHWTALTVSLASALVAAAMLTYLRAPTLDATAAAIDRRLQLQDRIVAALQVCRESDSVSALVVRDAATRLGASTPADVFPAEFGRRAVTGTLLLSITFLTLSIDPPGAASLRPARTGGAAVAVARADGASITADRLNDAPAAATEPAVRSVEPGNARPSNAQDADPRGESATEDVTERSPSPAGDSVTPPKALAPAASNATEIRPGIAPINARSAPGVQAERGGGGAASDGQSAAGAASRAAPGARAGAGGSAPDAGWPSRGEPGGVAAGRLDANAPSATSRITRGAEGAEGLARAPGAARAQAGSAAVSHDDIPPARRQYVRDYFLRLQTSGKPR